MGLLVFVVLFSFAAHAQSLSQPIYDTQRAFDQAVSDKGVKPAFQEFLAADAVIFRPDAVNGQDFLRAADNSAAGTLKRTVSYADISKNGILGYTTGAWTFTPKSKTAENRIGEYATVWSRASDGKYKAILDIEISHDPVETKKKLWEKPSARKPDSNKNGWSATDSIMNFLKLSMSAGLEGAYDKFASEDVILLREGLPPLMGRGKAKEAVEDYKAVDFPQKVSQLETADMAYSWNACSYADSNEGMEKGNCLHIWKLRDKRWWIVLGVFARVANETRPVLKERDRTASRP